MAEEIITLRCSNGSTIDLCRESNKDYGIYLSWSLAHNCMFGTFENSAELRLFLKRALRHLEKDQRRLEKRSAKQALGKMFPAAALAALEREQ
jgi:hypothetical protein